MLKNAMIILVAGAGLLLVAGCQQDTPEAAEVRAFVQQSRERDLCWANHDRAFYRCRDTAQPVHSTHAVPPPALMHGYEVEPILDRLYGEAH